MSSAARVEANRQNAQHSTGPRTAAGSQVSSLNAVRHGLTGQTMILPQEEAEAYRTYTEGFLKDLAPVGVHETQLAYSIMNGKWRLNQITVLESAIYTLGYREHAPQFANETPEMAAALARALTFDQKRKDLDRLRRYENAINRQVNKDAQILADLQNARKAAAEKQEKDAITLLTHFTTTGKSWNPADFGFVLSIDEIQRLEQRQFILNRAKAAQSM